jgi:predicted metal-binding membrane protein
MQEREVGTQARTVILGATLGVAAVAWVVALRQMSGMDMGGATELGSLWAFMALWVPMMAAMMLPGAVPAVSRFVRASGRTLAAPAFAGAYLVVWSVVGLAVYALYQPHGTVVAGALTIAAGLYELTPLKRECRRRCQSDVRTGSQFGLYCFGSSIGLMVLLVALGVMSVAWMFVVAAIVIAQKLLPLRVAVDVPLALAIVALGALVVIAPSFVPGLVVPM